ncbi:ABC transporter permease subunit [Aliiroseovarius crassostreae]|uniref:ABC transporter permease subunit n=1 Tax=Aliiroseovarius crassostreae TaxID=154981 RepID=UPI003C7B1FF1
MTDKLVQPFTQAKTAEMADRMAQEDVQGRSPWTDARRRFMANKAAMTSVLVLLLVFLFSVFGHSFSQFDIETIDWDVLGNVKEAGRPSIENGHFFGFDENGRDLYNRVVQGSRISLAVGVVGALVAVIVGTIYGATAGFIGGRTDSIMMRLVDIFMSIPYMFVLILLLVVAGRSITMIFVGIGLTAWLDMSRIVRGQTLSIKNREFVEAAVAIGVPTWQIIFRHIVPNLLGVVVVYATLLVPQMILTESFISFLGLGVQEPLTSWGALISEGVKSMNYGTLWQLGFPLSFFVITIFCFFFIGDGLRDALDPKDR